MDIRHFTVGPDPDRKLEESGPGGDNGVGFAKSFMPIEIVSAIGPFCKKGYREKLPFMCVAA